MKNEAITKRLKEKILIGGAYVVCCKIISFVSGLGCIAIIVRLLPAEKVGMYFLVFSLVNFASMLCLFGMQRAIVKFISCSLAGPFPEKGWVYVKKMFSFVFLFSMVVFFILTTDSGSNLLNQVFKTATMQDLAPYAGLWIVLYSIQRLLAESFRGYHDLKFAAIFNGVVVNFIKFLLLVLTYVFFLEPGLEVIFTIIFISLIINNIAGIVVLVNRHRPATSVHSGEVTANEILATSLPLGFSFFFLAGTHHLHLWLLAFYCSKESVAIYGSVGQMAIIVSAILDIVRLVIPSFVGHLYSENKFDEVEKLLRKASTVALLPSIGVLLVILFFGSSLLSSLFGEQYSSGSSALIILASAQFVNVITGTPGVLLVMASREKLLFYIAFFSGLVGLLISISLVRSMGFNGIAIGVSVGTILQNLIMTYYSYKRLMINTMASPKLVVEFTKFCKKALVAT